MNNPDDFSGKNTLYICMCVYVYIHYIYNVYVIIKPFTEMLFLNYTLFISDI